MINKFSFISLKQKSLMKKKKLVGLGVIMYDEEGDMLSCLEIGMITYNSQYPSILKIFI